MSVLSAAAQKQVEDALIKEGALSADKIVDLKDKAEKENTPFLSLPLLTSWSVPDETLTKAIAQVSRVPYVNLSSAHVSNEVLDLLPQETAERYMAVPLGEMQNRLVVAMLDAGNVQAVDFLANKIGRPLKVYAASESGIRNILRQYQANISKEVVGEISNIGAVAPKLLRVPKEQSLPTAAKISKRSCRTRQLVKRCQPYWSMQQKMARVTFTSNRFKIPLRYAVVLMGYYAKSSDCRRALSHRLSRVSKSSPT